MNFPKEIFVTHEEVDQDSGYYVVNTSAEDAISSSQSEEPVEVATYRLVEEQLLTLVRTVRVKKARSKNAA